MMDGMHETGPAEKGGIWRAWSGWRVLGLVVGLLAANYAVQLAVYAADGGLAWPALAGAVLGVVAPLLLLAVDGTLRPRADLGLRLPAARTVLLVLGFALAGVPVTSLLAGWSARLHPVDPEWLRLVNESLPVTPGEHVVTVLAVVVAAPLAEEIVFRALLQRLAARLWGGAPAAVVTALVFAILHAEPWHVFGLLGVGLVLAVVWEATRSLPACWLAHAAHNAVALSLMVAARDTSREEAQSDGMGGMLAAGSLVALLVLGWALLRSERRPAGRR